MHFERSESVQLKKVVVTLVAVISVNSSEVVAHQSADGLAVPQAVAGMGKESRADDLRAPPAHFKTYEAVTFGSGTCTVGASDEDGFYQRPYILVSEGADRRTVWSRELSVPRDFYQGRATHCLAHGGHLYVLLQMDTDSHQATNQTIVSVAKLTMTDGSVVGIVENRLPDTTGAVTEWVSGRNGVFRVDGDRIFISGSYRNLDSDEIKTFSTILSF